jgi:hypothetical protein
MAELKETRLPLSHCLSCGRELDAATSLHGATPNSGDITVCMKCGHVMAFADDLTVRALTDAEMYDIAGDKEVLTVQRLLHELHKEK